jgi:hypothetical protein
MRKSDKKKNIAKANLLAEQRYLESKGLVKESFHEPDGTPIGVDHNHMPITKDRYRYEDWADCHDCNGRGYEVFYDSDGEAETERCMVCGGTGKNPNAKKPEGFDDMVGEESPISDGGINEIAGGEFDLYNQNAVDNLERDLVQLLNRYLGISNTNDAGTSNDNRMFINNNLMKIVNQRFPNTSLRQGKSGNEIYTNRPEEMEQYLNSIGISGAQLKSVR